MEIKNPIKPLGPELDKSFSQIKIDSTDSNSLESYAIKDTAKRNLSSEVSEEEDVIRKPIKKGLIDKLVGKVKMKTPIGKLYSMGKSENKEATGSGGGVGAFDAPLFSTTKGEMEEKWSQKYKNSIDCNNPKGFSQKAHCQGKKKKQVSEEILKGGKADKKTLEYILKKHNKKDTTIDGLKKQLQKGIKVEMEHTDNKTKAKEIAMDHLYEDPKYYDKLKKIESKESLGGHLGKVAFKDSEFVRKSLPKKTETKEATGASSSGQYSTPAAWAKSTKKKDWRGKSKTQIPGGKFVQVKKKCKKFPYCNQGDINALRIFENETLKKVIKTISEKHNISENVIKEIIYMEYQKKILNK